MSIDVQAIRKDFPILNKVIDDKPLVYLDNAASAQKPKAVIDAVTNFYADGYSNIHRGNHFLSRNATEAYENARRDIADFINADSPDELIFVRGATEAINLVARSWGSNNIGKGDEILITAMEHHANIVPWQILAAETGASLKVAPISKTCDIEAERFSAMITPRTRLVAFTHVSNTLGTVNPAKAMIELAHSKGAITLLDGAQSAPHMPIDVKDLNCDFFAFSGHKLFGPTGIGALYAKSRLLADMSPYQSGGDMIEHVTFEKTTFKEAPAKFEAGTPHIAGAIGLAAAVNYLKSHNREALHKYECEILDYAERQMKTINGLHIVGEPTQRASSLSFHMPTAHHQDLADILDSEGIAVRTGHHCTEPLMRELGLAGTARASFSFYNTREEVDLLIEGLKKAIRMLG